MFDLERGERVLVAALIAILAVGLVVSFVLRARHGAPLQVTSFVLPGGSVPVYTDADISNRRTRVPLNTASAEELAALPGIGPALARRIIDYRTTHGPFAAVDDLEKVKGIGPKLLGRLRDEVTIP